MEPPGVVVPPDKDREKYLNNSNNQQIQPTIGVSTTGQQTIERLSRPMAFDKMECVVKEMQDSETGVPVRSQKLFLTSIPSAFMGYDLIEWLMERLSIEESEALNIANQLCLHGYFFPVNDSKTLVVKDDSSLYRFQTPYYWPWQHKAPDNVEYAIYLAKRSLRNKQRHGLEEYETEALANLHKNLKGKWDFITMQAEEQVKLAKERKKGDKIVGDSQERAYWRVHRPPPGQFTPLEACPVPSRDRQGKPRRRTVDDWSREVEILTTSLGRTRMKMSQACECLVAYCETFAEYDPIIQPALPSNPWVSEDLTFWQLNNTIVEIPTEKRVRRWAISIEEIVSDPTGLHEFTVYLKKEYSHENIRFWLAVNDLRRSSHSLISKKVKEIYEEFLAPGAPCEINIDGKTMENVQQGLKAPSRFAFDAAAEHIYALLLKKDCYPRFIRSEHYKSLIASGIQPSHKKRFFGFGGVAKKKSTTVAPNPALLAQATGSGTSAGGSHLARRRGSDRSLSGSAHELAVSGVKDNSKVPHSHSQSNLSDIPYREGTKSIPDNLETTLESGTSAICPWDDTEIIAPNVSVSICPWDDPESASVPTVATKTPIPVNIVTVTSATTLPTTTTTIPKVQSSSAIETGNSSASDICDVSERMRRSCGLRQNTLDCDFHSTKRLMATVVEHRRASVTVTPKISDLQFSNRQNLSLGATEKKGNITSSPVLKVKDTTKSNIGRTISFEDEELYNMLKSKTISEESLKNTNELNKNETINKINKLNDNLKTLSNINENNECKKVLSNNNSANLSKLTPESIASVKIESVSTPQALPPIINVVCPVIEIDSHELNESTESVDDTKQEVQIEQIVESSVLFKLEEEDDDDIQSENKLSFIMDEPILTEDLSPTTEEYQEGMPFQQTDQPDSEEYDLATGVCILTPGCVAPAPTPCNVGKLSQITAPLAEVEIDPPDDEGDLEIKQGCDSHEEHKKRKKKREKSSDGQEKQDDPDLTKPNEQTNRYAVCPWEDEDVTTTVDTPFVKTYSTLGYL